MKQGPIIYNLFPRLVGAMKAWVPHMERAAGMGFDTVYVNPFHYPGFSGSLYSPKDYYAYNPLFLGVDRRPGHEQLTEVVAAARKSGLRFMMDLVINHTAIDCPLVQEHPEWYRRDAQGKVEHPSAIDPADSTKVTVWGDLAEIDNAASTDKEGLWSYWEQLVLFYQKLGIRDFRCDAAFKVPADLWSRLVTSARKADPDVRFFAETLGCRIEEVQPLATAGFDYIFNSSKWWNFGDPWCLEQYEKFRAVAPSVAFPESHDTPRLAAEVDGNEAALKMRYAFSALYSAGVMTVLGYEWGFRKQVNVVNTQPFDMEPHHCDISGWITEVNRLKRELEIFNVEPKNEQISAADSPVFMLKKSWGKERVLLILNRNLTGTQPFELNDWDTKLEVAPGTAGGPARGKVRDVSPGSRMGEVPRSLSITLAPAQVLVLYAKLD